MSLFFFLQCQLLLQKKRFFFFCATHVCCNKSSQFFSYYTCLLQCMLVVQKNKRKCKFSSSSCCNVKNIKLFIPYCVNDYFLFSIHASFSFCFEGVVACDCGGAKCLQIGVSPTNLLATLVLLGLFVNLSQRCSWGITSIGANQVRAYLAPYLPMAYLLSYGLMLVKILSFATTSLQLDAPNGCMQL